MGDSQLPGICPNFRQVKPARFWQASGTDARHRRGWIPQGEAYWPWSASSIGTASKATGRDIYTAKLILLRILTFSRFIRA